MRREINVDTINFEKDFWKLYPEFGLIEEFKEIKKKYKLESSRVMWFIAFCYHLDSIFRKLEESERVEMLSKDWMKDKDWYKDNRKYIQEAINKFIDVTDTKLRRHIRQWEDTLDQRTKFMKSLEYDISTYEDIDKMALNTEKILKVFDLISKQVDKESGATTKANAIPSLADSDDI